ncbi:DNA-binding transcriptional response regulator, NtrC family, contains REC, AAA-type ATPase, and a Fis-type DNA-binding domains [Desulfonatronum thiosulfatophilum]|uniref:DNA-binding transcriptional response regulator, NtrC family, contains REC, AAA-type ATPase, and a Fis-type DNA-binding domains n=1 Tax=Desulfonatronum thiosulfatophilum TaxID=617002 RepID=A0A1G6BP46_9BACT|nr:sigma-54 dependent transcriptional regulator [Desulfonatronum thiosulfatophilum]SDB22369.1 DNA-binding transcriptional response regulator, NtrC family, contains REC, AAA-type ATPase, and a Fis-type DNA-binding domains [Desulfonatronum thiosulfatophilum]
MTSRQTGQHFSGSKVLVVEDDRSFGQLLSQELQDHELAPRWVDSAEKALSVIQEWQPELVVSDMRLPGIDGLELLRQVKSKEIKNAPDFLLITAFGSISKAVEALKAGAEDFLTKPLDLDHFTLTVVRVLRNRALRQEVQVVRDYLSQDAFHGMVGQSSAMRGLFEQIRRVSQADGPVLILGESGTGKELVARAVHAASPRRKGAFQAVNCAGIPEQLLESEFFGHKAGAFTGAGKARRGLFIEAEGGTLFLDEISEMPLFLQAKLLRILQDGKVRPVGADKEEQVNVRTVAATHRNLEQEVDAGRFREDLFFRLETFTLRLPPLRERAEDLELLAGRFLRRFSIQMGKNIHYFDQKSLELLNTYPFPGNVRELRNAVERAVTFCDGTTILPKHLPSRIRDDGGQLSLKPARLLAAMAADGEHLPSLAQAEQHYIQHVLNAVNGNKRRAAAVLDIHRRTLYRKLE